MADETTSPTPTLKADRGRANFIGAPEAFNLNAACRLITEAFGYNVYLVGSSLTKRDHRDVDIRCILPDEEFDKIFPVAAQCRAVQFDARWALFSAAISEWLAARTGLKIDFQFQRQTEVCGPEGKERGKERQPLGMYLCLKENGGHNAIEGPHS